MINRAGHDHLVINYHRQTHQIRRPLDPHPGGHVILLYTFSSQKHPTQISRRNPRRLSQRMCLLIRQLPFIPTRVEPDR
jgi:hypothetical protein